MFGANAGVRSTLLPRSMAGRKQSLAPQTRRSTFIPPTTTTFSHHHDKATMASGSHHASRSIKSFMDIMASVKAQLGLQHDSGHELGQMHGNDTILLPTYDGSHGSIPVTRAELSMAIDELISEVAVTAERARRDSSTGATPKPEAEIEDLYEPEIKVEYNPDGERDISVTRAMSMKDDMIKLEYNIDGDRDISVPRAMSTKDEVVDTKPSHLRNSTSTEPDCSEICVCCAMDVKGGKKNVGSHI